MSEPLPEQSFRDLRKRRSAPGTGLVLAIVGLVLLAVIGFGVLALLVLKAPSSKPAPGDTATAAPTNSTSSITAAAAPAPEPAGVTPAPEPPKPPVDPVLLAKQREAAEDALGRQLKLQRSLIDIEGQTWGGKNYSNALTSVTKADTAYQDEDFPAAEAAYEEALLHLNLVEAGKGEAFANYMQAGTSAMAASDGDAASEAFLIATRIEPENSEAAHLLKRASTLNQVVAKLAKAELHEADGRLAFASAELSELVSIDAEYEPGQHAYKRVQAAIVEGKFQTAMSDALAAYERKAYLEAKGKLIGARAMQPDSPQIKETMKLIDAGIKQDKLNLMQAQGRQAISAEDYEQALSIFNEALRVEPNVAFAREGAAYAAESIKLLQQINRFLDAPENLSNENGLENAAAISAEAIAFENPGPQLARKIVALDELVVRARTPSPVLLTSDGKTSVDVYKVGRFGTIKSKELKLKPGSYTAVGVRPGYRDARIVFKVEFGKVPAPVHVACIEKIP